MKPWLWLPTRLAHDLSPYALGALGRALPARPIEVDPLHWRGLRFPNRLGVAGGVDKNGATVRGWWALGAGFVEVGTVTPRPQGPNPGVIMARDIPRRALWNKMGFPSEGASKVAARLARLPRPRPTPLFVTVGKNRDTANETAARDYAAGIEALYTVADAFVINISSPNTKGLRDLQEAATLRTFLREVTEARDRAASRVDRDATAPKPLLLKLSPDLDPEGIAAAVEAGLGLDGFVVSNTTLAREPGSPFPAEGGASGAPLAARSKAALHAVVRALGAQRGDKLIVSVGGIDSVDDIRERRAMGADLVQVYTALVFEGPGFFRDRLRALRDHEPAHPPPQPVRAI
jgi:dihydroorotate dehydrogenase